MTRPIEPGGERAVIEVKRRLDGSELRFECALVTRTPRLLVEVSYTALLLDLWVEHGAPRWEDDDEVRAATDAGSLAPADVARIEATRRVLERGYARIVAEVRREVLGEAE